MTQEEFSDISEFSQQYVSGLETGRRNPTIVTLYELAKPPTSSPANLFSSNSSIGG
jgi:transcriptional regulator with XRE-family HTH domain